jgi:multiple sugar transport system substrate-binding protein
MVSDGRALAALGWPSLLPAGAPPSAEPSAVRFAPLPLAEEIYSQTRNHWENQSLRIPVVLLGVEGRLIGVSRASRNAVAAFRLAQWLSSGDVAVQLSSRSRGTLWFRASQASSQAKWTGGAPAQDGATLTELVSASLSSDSAVLVPRVPGIDEYLVALGKAVNASAAGEAGAAAALKAVAQRWEAITERLGRDEQVRAYRRHLGIETMDEP